MLGGQRKGQSVERVGVMPGEMQRSGEASCAILRARGTGTREFFRGCCLGWVSPLGQAEGWGLPPSPLGSHPAGGSPGRAALGQERGGSPCAPRAPLGHPRTPSRGLAARSAGGSQSIPGARRHRGAPEASSGAPGASPGPGPGPGAGRPGRGGGAAGPGRGAGGGGAFVRRR